MKKIYLLLSFLILSFGIAKSTVSSHSRIITNPYIQTQVTKTIFESAVYNMNWIKSDSTKVIFDFIDNNRIIINRDIYKNVYNVRVKKIDEFDNCKRYIMNGVDSYNNRYIINVLYYYDNSVLLIIQNDSSIIRYKIHDVLS